MYAAVVSSAVAVGLIGLGTLAPSSDTSERGPVVTTSCAQTTYPAAPSGEQAACAPTYTAAYPMSNR